MNNIYLDNSASTYTDDRVLTEMLPYFTLHYGNSSSQHQFGRNAIEAVDKARHIVASSINSKDNEIYFTSGGTESNNWAIKGIAYGYSDKGNHIITSAIEHSAVLNSCKYLEKRGYDVTYLPVDRDGLISINDLKNAITDKTILITIMASNNEIGTIEPIKEIGAVAKENKVLFHTDAVQAMASMPIDVRDMNIDLLSLSAHKLYGPKGVGALYIRNGIKIESYMSGGGHERKKRSGTLNTPGIVGLGKAVELTVNELEDRNKHIGALRDYLVNRVISEIPHVLYNGPKGANRMANNANFSFEFIEGEALLMSLDLEGIAVSSGSACSSGSLKASHVIDAIGIPAERAQGTIRFSLGKDNNKEEIDYTIQILKKAVNRLRAMSPLFKEDKGGSVYV